MLRIYESDASTRFRFTTNALKRTNDKRLLRDISGIWNILNICMLKYAIIILVSLSVAHNMLFFDGTN